MAQKGDKLAPPPDFAEVYLRCEGVRKRLTDHYNVAPQTAGRWIKEIEGEIKHLDLADVPKGRPAEMLRERDLDPDEWEVVGMKVNEWETTTAGDEGEPVTSLNRQTRMHLTPRKTSIRAARPDGWKPPKPRPSRKTCETDTMLIGDHQAPFHDRAMHGAVVNYLADVAPRRVVILGDLLDLPSVSKYTKKPLFHAATNECIDAAYKIICDYRSASPDSELFFLHGNHEQRLLNMLLRDFQEAAEIRRAEDDRPALSLDYLMRFDELGITSLSNYPHDVLKLSENTAVRHGDKSRGGSGATGRAETQSRRYNIFVGHNHKQSITEHTAHDIDGDVTVTYGIEVGCSCEVKGGLGYAVEPDWQQGAATATFDKDGTMTPELVSWTDGKLRWRGDWWK